MKRSLYPIITLAAIMLFAFSMDGASKTRGKAQQKKAGASTIQTAKETPTVDQSGTKDAQKTEATATGISAGSVKNKGIAAAKDAKHHRKHHASSVKKATKQAIEETSKAQKNQ